MKVTGPGASPESVRCGWAWEGQEAEVDFPVEQLYAVGEPGLGSAERTQAGAGQKPVLGFAVGSEVAAKAYGFPMRVVGPGTEQGWIKCSWSFEGHETTVDFRAEELERFERTAVAPAIMQPEPEEAPDDFWTKPDPDEQLLADRREILSAVFRDDPGRAAYEISRVDRRVEPEPYLESARRSPAISRETVQTIIGWLAALAIVLGLVALFPYFEFIFAVIGAIVVGIVLLGALAVYVIFH